MQQDNKIQIVRFAPKKGEGFYDTLKKNIEVYFKENKINKHGNYKMVVKTFVIVSMYLIPYGVMVSGVASSSLLAYFGLWFLMGLGMVGIGCGVMHDSNHGSYSNNKLLNGMLARIATLVGGYHVTWRLQHNILHHTYTNIEGLDDDIEAGGMLRFSPHSKKYAFHKYQHLYAWVLYGLLTLQWATIKDFKQVYDYHNRGLLRKEKKSLPLTMFQLSLYKLAYYAYVLVLPMIFSGVAWYYVLIGFVIMHFVAGLLLSCIFQLAHVMEECEFPEPDSDRKMKNNWAVHQLLNTANFSPKSKIMAYFVGGLNRQIEHHLFPQICHVHYKDIAPIVKKTAQQYNLPYFEKKTFLVALVDHAKMLKKMGQQA